MTNTKEKVLNLNFDHNSHSWAVRLGWEVAVYEVMIAADPDKFIGIKEKMNEINKLQTDQKGIINQVLNQNNIVIDKEFDGSIEQCLRIIKDDRGIHVVVFFLIGYMSSRINFLNFVGDDSNAKDYILKKGVYDYFELIPDKYITDKEYFFKKIYEEKLTSWEDLIDFLSSFRDSILKNKQCFVLMPFKPDFDEIYEDIKDAVEKSDLECQRADDIFHNNTIIDFIKQKITSSLFCIADLTEKNPNVFYEVGLAHAMDKKVILITQNKEDVPFDLQHIQYIMYTKSRKGQEELIANLTESIRFFMNEKNNF